MSAPSASAWLTSDQSAFVTFRLDEVAAWRLDRRMRTVIEVNGVEPGRRLLAALALVLLETPRDQLAADPLGALRRSQDELVTDLLAELPLDPKPSARSSTR